MNMHNNSFDFEISDLQALNNANDNFEAEKESYNLMTEEPDAEALVTAYYCIAKSWHMESIHLGQRILLLLSEKNYQTSLCLSEGLLPQDIFQLPTYSLSDLRFFLTTTLQN